MIRFNKANHMKKIVGIITVLTAAALLGACSSKKNGGAYGLNGGANGGDPNAVGYRDGPVTPGTERDFTVNVGDKVFFKTDSASLTPDAQETLRGQAKWLNQYPNHTITVEGHSDERGTREYNLGLAAKQIGRAHV